ncbi:TPA: hypothetical protein L4F62_006492 [Pseudomonas aeruginosa]|uniref:hypothetical protein n=1 Tax=Pseudomonas aeruginosa TaxID=287 RepID=UPI0025535CF6|nr:hypothetical protein [Pseudomonas aeruginosa]HBO1619930.1 hypothetical protein [Pseudomonas aeruginosa]HBO9387499.1 hypothetical protein [Pseudomonas aeruginosa]
MVAAAFACTTKPVVSSIEVGPPELSPPEDKANPFNVGSGVLARDSVAQKGGMVIAANGPKWTSNPFGHTGMGFDGEGVYSYGTANPDGCSFSDYVLEEAQERDSIYFILLTRQLNIPVIIRE